MAPRFVTGSFSGITTTNTYNKRLQPITLSAAAPSATILSLSYDFHLGAGDNGNVFQVVNNRDSTRTVNYTYDALNRIASGFTTGNRWGTSYAIDAWGNLYQKNPVSGKLATDPLTQTATTQNQFSGFCYDLAGNLLGQSGCPGLPYTPTYSYDAENRMTTTAGVTYTYDGDGKRVKKSSGTLYWTGMGSDALDETDLAGTVQREYVFFNGKRVARLTPPSTVRYFYSDHLGSHDLVTSATGAIQEESDYHPYGEEAVIVDTLSTQPYKFTGKERDAESGLDYFGARHYSLAMGRFMTPDWATKPTTVPYALFDDPETLNLYGYVRNNPLGRADLDGHGDGSIRDRVILGLTGLANVYIGQEKIGAAAVAGIAAPEIGGASAPLAAYGAISGTGQVVSGGAQIIGAITGKTQTAEQVSNAVSASTTISGVVTTVATNGDIDAGAKAASAEAVLTPAVTRELFKSATNFVDALLGAKDLVSPEAKQQQQQQPQQQQQQQEKKE